MRSIRISGVGNCLFWVVAYGRFDCISIHTDVFLFRKAGYEWFFLWTAANGMDVELSRFP